MSSGWPSASAPCCASNGMSRTTAYLDLARWPDCSKARRPASARCGARTASSASGRDVGGRALQQFHTPARQGRALKPEAALDMSSHHQATQQPHALPRTTERIAPRHIILTALDPWNRVRTHPRSLHAKVPRSTSARAPKSGRRRRKMIAHVRHNANRALSSRAVSCLGRARPCRVSCFPVRWYAGTAAGLGEVVPRLTGRRKQLRLSGPVGYHLPFFLQVGVLHDM